MLKPAHSSIVSIRSSTGSPVHPRNERGGSPSSKGLPAKSTISLRSVARRRNHGSVQAWKPIDPVAAREL